MWHRASYYSPSGGSIRFKLVVSGLAILLLGWVIWASQSGSPPRGGHSPQVEPLSDQTTSTGGSAKGDSKDRQGRVPTRPRIGLDPAPLGSWTGGEGSVDEFRSNLDSNGDGWPDSMNGATTPGYTDIEQPDPINAVDPSP